MDLSAIIDRVGEPVLDLLIGVIAGGMFGAFAQKSRFCLRSAAIEFARGVVGSKVAIWVLTFSAAVLGTSLLVYLDIANLSEARQFASPQSLSGALTGGLLFGTGMVLARGCSSRLLVLAATGNMRSMLSGLVFAVVAQASLHGFLAPAREFVAGLYTTADIGGNDLLSFAGIGKGAAALLALSWLAAGIYIAARSRAGWVVSVSAALAGLAIPLAWYLTSTLSAQAFDPVPVRSLTFTGPSADVLMLFLNPFSEIRPDFNIGLVHGVFFGSFLAAAFAGELKLEGYEGGPATRRAVIGAAFMGFGGMLAGGCAVGAGVTGASVFAVTAWVTLSAIWFSAAVTDRLVDGRSPVAIPAPRG